MPERFLDLKEEQQDGALVALRQVEAGLRQAALDEWAARCEGGMVRHPAGYLFGILQKAIRGDFKTWAARDTDRDSGPDGRTNRAESADKSGSGEKPASPEAARKHLERLVSIVRKPGSGP